MKAEAAAAPSWSWHTTLLAASRWRLWSYAGPLLTAFLGRSSPCWPSTVAAYVLHVPVETIGTRFGGIPSGLPHMIIPRWHATMVHGLLGPAFTVAMLGAPLFGGLPATGAIARTATNIRSGARSPVAGMVHSPILLAILLFAAPLPATFPWPLWQAS